MTKSEAFYQLLHHYDPEEILNTLSPHLSEKRIHKIDPILESRLESIHVAVEDPADIHNALAIVRTSEAFGLMHVHIIGKPDKRKGKQTMQGADRWVELHYYQDFSEFHQFIKANNLSLYGATPKGDDMLTELPVKNPLCLMFGNEMRGLSPMALEACDKKYVIPMFGFSESFNLSVSAAISLYDVTERKRKLLQASGDLSSTQKLVEKAWFFARTVGVEKATKILENQRELIKR